jgi:hypothetical protein
MIIPGVDKAAGLARCEKAFFRYLRRTGESLSSNSCTAAAFATAHGELWDVLATEDIRGFIAGTPGTDAADDLILFIVAQCAAIQLVQYPTLP